MDKKNFPLYSAILFVGLAISFFVIKGNFSLQSSGIVIFFLLFIPTLLKPDLGLIIVIVSMLFSPEIIIGSTSARLVAIRAEDLILLVIILAWFIKTAFTKNILATFRTPLTFPFFLYILACITSSLFAVLYGEIDIRLSFFTILKYFEYFILFIMTVDILKNMKQVKLFMLIFFLTAFAVAVYSNFYVNQQLSAGAEFIRVAPPIETRGGGESGTLGGYLIFVMAMGAGLLLYAQTPLTKILLICLELLMLRAFLYTLSRGSYLAVIPVITALIYFTKRNKLILIYCLGVIFFLLVFFAPQMVKERITTTVTTQDVVSGKQLTWEESPRARLDSWKEVLFNRFPQRPILGYGVAKFFIDGQIFLTLNEVGLLGFILFCWVLARLFKLAKKVMDTEIVKSDSFSSGISVGFLAGFVGLLCSAISTNTFLIVKVMEPFWFIAAIILSLPGLLKEELDVVG